MNPNAIMDVSDGEAMRTDGSSVDSQPANNSATVTCEADPATESEASSITSWLPKRHVPDAVLASSHLSALFSRVQTLLGTQQSSNVEKFFPKVPESLSETGLTADEIERLILKYLLQ